MEFRRVGPSGHEASLLPSGSWATSATPLVGGLARGCTTTTETEGTSRGRRP